NRCASNFRQRIKACRRRFCCRQRLFRLTAERAGQTGEVGNLKRDTLRVLGGETSVAQCPTQELLVDIVEHHAAESCGQFAQRDFLGSAGSQDQNTAGGDHLGRVQDQSAALFKV